MTHRRLLLGSLLLAFASACPTTDAPVPDPKPTPPTTTEWAERARTAEVRADEQTCERSSDCVLTAGGCCGCSSGGVQTAVSSANVTSLTTRRKELCAGVMCAQMMSKDASCAARKAVCIGGMCLTEPAAPAGLHPKPIGGEPAPIAPPVEGAAKPIGLEPIPDAAPLPPG